MKKYVFPSIIILMFETENIVTSSGDMTLDEWKTENPQAEVEVHELSEMVKFTF